MATRTITCECCGEPYPVQVYFDRLEYFGAPCTLEELDMVPCPRCGYDEELHDLKSYKVGWRIQNGEEPDHEL